ncbi:MAG: InlB B-repeat-containing protein [Marmoricola sp.]
MTKEVSGTRSRSRTFAALLGVVGLILMSAGLSLVVQGSASAATAKVHKSYVCKYVDKPGQPERLQSGQNPIWVDNHSLLGYNGLVTVGQQFKDAQGRSVVIVANTVKLNPEPSISSCPGVVTPGVQFIDSVCLNGSATTPSVVETNLADITYTITSGSIANGSSVTITATPKSGFAFLPGANNVFSHTFGPAATGCGEGPTVVTPGVTFTDSVCSNGAPTAPSFTPTNTADIVYTVTSGAVADGSPVTITATPKAGFAFAPGTNATFTHTFSAAATNCGGSSGKAVATTAALFQNPSCANGNTVAAKLDGSGFLSPAQWDAKGNFIDTGKVTYTITGSFAPGGTVNVAASADQGFKLTASSVSQWTHTFGQIQQCSHANHITIPAEIHSGFTSVGMTPAGTNSALYTWGYSLAGTGAAFFLTALVVGRRRQSVS